MKATDSRAWVDDVLSFWFDDLSPRDWWRGSPDIDARVRARFADLYERLVRERPEPATLDARAHLAAVIVFDQFSRHLFRGRPAAFATDPLALAMTFDALDRGLDDALTDTGRQFLYMPLMREDPVIQNRSIAQFTRLADVDALRSAREHFETIARYGRFPARNAALGRASTEAEIASIARSRRRPVSPSA